MTIAQLGSVNTTALIVPGLLVQIVPPQNIVLNGVPTNRLGIVGTAQWGPVNQSTIIGTMQNYAQTFGAIQNRKYDMGTAVAAAVQQGASDFRCVRVTDGTDAAASLVFVANCMTYTALYTGTLGNQVTVTHGPGAQTGTLRVVVSLPGVYSEVFNNIPMTGNGTTTAPSQAIAAAINTGAGQLRGASNLIRATAGSGTTAYILTQGTALSLTGGADGVTTITASVLVGSDAATPRTGMYALRGQGTSVGMLADADDSTQWTTQAGFGLSEGIYMIGVAPAGIVIQNGTTGVVDIKASAGLDTYAFKLMHGDWIWWNDQTNNVTRLISPQGFVAGRLANLSPEQSSLNKPLYGVVGSQKSGLPGGSTFQIYADADLAALFQPGVDVISNPQPGGTYWGVRCGHNSSSNAATNGDNYTRMTNYIAATLNAGMGVYVGMTITPDLFKRVRATLLSFLQNLLNQGVLGLTTSGGLPFSVVCDVSNNPFSRTSLDYLQADIQVQYMAINEKFIINVEGGQTVNITRQTTPSGQGQ